MNDLVSIIVPVYNVYEYLDECLKSLINQTYKNIEIIVINDGSTDKSLSICEKYTKKDKRIKLINQKNSGLSYTRNIGIKNSKGKYISFIDSDDIINNKMIEIMYTEIIRNNSDICVCKFQNFTNEFINKNIDYNVEVLSKDEFFIELMHENKITNHVCNKLFKKELFNNIEFPIKRKYEDIGTLYKAVSNIESAVYIDYDLYGYRNREGSIVNNLSKETLIDYQYMVKKRYDDLIVSMPHLKKYFDMNRINYTVRYNLEILRSKQYELFDDLDIKDILNKELEFSCKVYNKSIRKINLLKQRIAFDILRKSFLLFNIVFRIFYLIKK
ncbi:MAG: glycosyltransferase family 2 protein [Bacilli bacterium]|nr:glycosyltransferase family 2 protein [Bacilli bacterium]